MSKILVIASHPDDECLGCGATMHKYANEGHDVYCLILGEGAICRELEGGNLIKQSQEAGKIIGFKDMRFECLPDNKFDTIPLLDICHRIERHVNKICPDTVYTHFKGDLNIDHRLTFQATMTAMRPNRSSVKEIYSYEVPSSTEWGFEAFKPNVFVEISYQELDTKIKAMQCYTTEIRPYPHPRSAAGLRAHAEYFGTVAGVKLAEAFELIRKIM